MNKIVRTGIQGPLLAVVLAMLLAGLSTYGQGAATHADRGRTAVQKAVASARSASFWIVTQDFRGTFDKVDSYLETFTAEFVRQGLDVSLQSESPTAILVLYEDPALERMNRLSVGFIVPTSVKAQAPLQAQLWQQDLAATVPHRGPYQDLEKEGASLNSEL
ncbi:MAG TPA: hypothetical protein PK413_05730, partial [Thermoanaerobaculia bacterium]|nr:hypothetical protein [Thermoanaerobaculia bacterium]